MGTEIPRIILKQREFDCLEELYPIGFFNQNSENMTLVISFSSGFIFNRKLKNWKG